MRTEKELRGDCLTFVACLDLYKNRRYGRGHLMKDTRANLYSAKTMLAVIDQHLSECGAKYPDGEADQDG